MTDCSLLEQTLAANLSWNRARIKFLSRFLLALFAARTVNLAQIAVFFSGQAKIESNYKRIQRFLKAFKISEAEVARLIVSWLKLAPPFVLTIDRTEWRLGKRWVNVLMLAIATDSVAVPLCWLVFEKKGCSDAKERKAILERYLKIYPVETIRFVTADREFACSEWLQFLSRRRIGFCLRIKSSAQITDKCGKKMRASKLLQTVRVGARVACRRRRKMCNVSVSVAGMRKACGDNVIVISSAESATELLPNYCLRWQIETLFGCLKTRGFRLEDTHLTDVERVSRLLTLLTLAFCWAMVSGDFVCRQQPLKKKKHGRLEKSVFRVGLDSLRRLFCRPTNERQRREKKRFILLLSCT